MLLTFSALAVLKGPAKYVDEQGTLLASVPYLD